MGTYRTSKKTTSVIIAAGRKLFYENGYKATHCTTISKEAGVNPGLIHYYYRTKGNIALQIYSALLSSIRKQMLQLFPEMNKLLKSAVESRIYWYLIAHSEEWKRFICEISMERIPLEISNNDGKEYFIDLSDHLPDIMDDNMLILLCTCSIAAQTEMILSYAKGDSSLSEETLADLDVKTMFELLSVPQEKVQELIEQSKLILNHQIDVKMKRDFYVTISRINSSP